MNERLLDEYDEDSVVFQDAKDKRLQEKKKCCWWNILLACVGFISGNFLINKVQVIIGFIIMGISLICTVALRKKYKMWPQIVLIVLGILPNLFIAYHVWFNGVKFEW